MPNQADRMNEERSSKTAAERSRKAAAEKRRKAKAKSKEDDLWYYDAKKPTFMDAADKADKANKKNSPTEVAKSAPAAKAAEPAKKQSFKEAFAANRKAGKKEFKWTNAKGVESTYTTKLLEEVPSQPATKKESAPKEKPKAPVKPTAKLTPAQRAEKRKNRPDSRYMY